MSQGTSQPDTATSARARWPYQGRPQLHLLLAAVPVLIGSFLPWLETSLMTFPGTAGPGLWTLCAGVIALAGGMLKHRSLVLVHATIVAVAAIGLPVWQVARVLQLVGWGGWFPGTGMFLVVVGGVASATAAVRLARR